jgi:hypothetical protein
VIREAREERRHDPEPTTVRACVPTASSDNVRLCERT